MPDFQRRHYESLADALAEHASKQTDLFTRTELSEIVDRIANMLERDNTRFDRRRFYARVWRDGVA